MKNKSLLIMSCIAVGVTSLVLLSSKQTNDDNQPVNLDPSLKRVTTEFGVDLKGVASKQNKLEKDNARLKETIAKLSSDIKKGNFKSDSKSNSEKYLLDKIASLENQISDVKKANNKESLKISNKKYQVGHVSEYLKSNQYKPVRKSSYVNLDEEADAHNNKGGDVLLPNNINFDSHVSNKSNNDEKLEKFYTIPAGSDVQNATLLTSLIGEVPLNGKLYQPLFPFSAIVSRGELMSANGINLPQEIIGMKVGGFVYGVGSFLDNISCVRAYATSLLFVFKDGTYKSIVNSGDSNTTSNISQNSFAYLSDQYGNPCIKGKFDSNAPRVASALMGGGALQGLGEGAAAYQTSTTVGQGSAATAATGNLGTFLLGKSASQAGNEANTWIKDRVKDSFDIVTVPASIPYKTKNGTRYKPNRLMLHFTQNIDIDKSSTSRRIDYGKQNKVINDVY